MIKIDITELETRLGELVTKEEFQEISNVVIAAVNDFEKEFNENFGKVILEMKAEIQAINERLPPVAVDPVEPEEPTPDVPTDIARAWVDAQRGIRVNIERDGGWWGLGDFGHGINSYTKLKESGVVGVRLFYNWKYTGFGHPPRTMPPASSLDSSICNSISNALKAGLYVHVGLMDVIYRDDTVGADDGGKMTKDFVARFGDVLKARAIKDNWDMSKVLINPVNEWAGESNKAYNAFRLELHKILRERLGPDAILGIAPSAWGDPRALDDDFAIPNDGPLVVELHHYPKVINGRSAFYWKGIQDKALAWSKVRGGVPVVLGEAAASDATNQDGKAGDPWIFIDMIKAVAEGAPDMSPALWTITKAGWFRLNKSSTNPEIMDGSNGQPDLVGVIKYATEMMRGELWVTTIS